MALPSLKFPTLGYTDKERKKKPAISLTIDYPEWQPTTPGLRALKEIGSAPTIAINQEMIRDIIYGTEDTLESGVSGFFKSVVEGIEKGTTPLTALIPSRLEAYTGEKEVVKKEPPSFWSKLDIIVNQIGKLPEYIAAKVIISLKGDEGADVVDKGWEQRFVQKLKVDKEDAIRDMYKKYGTTELFKGIELEDFNSYIDSLSYSVTSASAGLAVGAPVALLSLSPVIGLTAGGAASAKIAFEMTSYELMQEYLEIKDEQMRKAAGRGITREEQQVLKDRFSYLAKKYGLWEAIPEAVGQVISFKVLVSPLVKMFGNSMALRIVGGASTMLGGELATETITQMAQTRIRYQAGLPGGEMRDWFSGEDWMVSLKEIAPQTIALTVTLGGIGGVVVKTESVIRTLSRELGPNTSAFDFYRGKLELFLNKRIEERKADVEKQFPGYTLKEPVVPFIFGGTIEPLEPIEPTKPKVEEITARSLVESKTKKEIQDKLQRIFGTYEELDKLEEIDPDNKRVVIADKYMADIERAASDRDLEETSALLKRAKEELAIKPEVKPVTPEEEAELSKIYQQQFEEIQTAGEKKIFTDIRELGGIKTDPSLREEMSDLPIDIIRTDGVTPDEMMEMLNEKGYNIESISDLFDSIRDIRSMPTRFRPAETVLEKTLRTVKAIRTKMPKVTQEQKILIDLQKEITKQITKKRFTLAQRLAQKEIAEVKITKERAIAKISKEKAVRKAELKGFRETIRRNIQGLREGRIKTKQEIQQVQNQLVGILDKSELELKDKAKFRATIKNIQTQEQLLRYLPEFQERIERLLEAEDVRELKSQIKGVLAETKVRMQAGKPVGKFTPIVQKVLDTAREAMKLNEKESEAKIIDNLDKYKEKTMPVEVAVENRILDMNSQGPAGLRELLKIITEIKETGAMAKALKDFNIQEEIDRERNYLIDVVTDYKGIAKGKQTTGREKADFKTRAKQSLMSLGHSFILSWRGLMQVLDWHTQVDKKTMADRYSVLDQENKYKELQEEYINDFNQMFTDIYNIPMETTKDKTMLPLRINAQIGKLKQEVDLGTFKNSIGEELNIKLTRDEMIKRYMEFQDETLYDSFQEGNNYTEEIRDAIRAKLTEQEKSLAGEQMILYRNQYDKINPIYRKMYGVDLPFNNFYSPIMREGYKIDLKDGFQTFLDEITIRKAVTSKSFITRVKNALPIARQGSLEALDRHITQTNYFIAWSEKIRRLDSIFSDSGVREVITEEFGGTLLRQIMMTIEDLAYNRRLRGDIHGSVNWFRQKFTLGALMLKPALAAKQMVSTVAYLEKLNPIEFTVGVVDFWRNPVKNYQVLAKESTFIRTRGKGGEIERDIRAAMQSSVYKRFSVLHSFWNIAMMNIRMGDKGAIITGSWALRRAELKKGVNLTETIRGYEEFSAETQQSADISQLSAVQKGGTFSVLFTMFKSSQRQYLAKEVNAVKTLFQKGGTSPKNIGKVARVIFIYHILLPVLFQWVANFGGWDEEDRKEYLRAGILGSLNGLFIFGDIVDGIIRAAMGLRTWPQEVPIATIGKDLEQAIKKIDFEDITAEDVKDALFELVEAGNSLGIPVQYAKNLPMGLKEIIEGDIYKGIGLLLGWSAYSLREPKGKVPPGIKTKGLKMPSLKFKTPRGLPSLKFPKLQIR